MPSPAELKDITSMSAGTRSRFAFGGAALTRPGVIATPVEQALVNAAKVHNAIHGTDQAKRADVTALRAVYRRGAKSYSKSRHPASSRRKWAMQRVKNHLTMLATGERPHARYVQDDDLLPAKHKHATSTKGERKALLTVEGRPAELGVGEPVSIATAAFMLEGKGFPEAISALEIKGAWDPNKHPRDHRGRFIHIGAAIAAVIDGKQQQGTVLSMSRGQVRVRTADGAEHTVAAASTEVTDHVGKQMSVMEHARAHTDADKKARQLERDGHPEAAAWSQRRDELGTALKARVQAGESIHDPYAPPDAGAEDLTTAEGLHKHLTGPAHGAADVPEFGQDEHAEHADMHDRAHQLGADHTHPAPGAMPTEDDATGEKPGDSPTRPDGTEWGSGYSPDDPRANPDYDRYVANLNAKLDQALEQVGGTDEVHDHVDGIEGAYQPARQAMHDAIIDELMAKYEDVPRERKAVMLAGPSGAGKSTTIKLLGHEFGVESKEENGEVVPTNFATVNPDDIKEIMVKRGMVDPGLYGKYGFGPGEPMTIIHEESSHIAKALHSHLAAHGTNILVDGTFSGRLDKNVGKIQKLRSSGYTVTGVLVDGDIDRSLTNAGKRHTKIKAGVTPDTKLDTSAPMQGRYVPLDHIEAQRPNGYYSELMDRPHRSQNAENFEQAQEAFNGGIRIYDNSSGAAKLIYSDEPQPGTEPKAEGLPNETLDRLKNGSTGTVRSGDLPGVIAQALRRAASEDRPQIIQAGIYGYGIAHAPIGNNDYFEISPGGHVTDVHRDLQTGVYTRKPLPVTDVQKIVDHYVKDTHTQLPRPRRRTPLPNGERVIHEDGRRGHVEHVGVERLRPGDDLINPVTGAAMGKVNDVRVGPGFTETATDKTPLGRDRELHVEGQPSKVQTRDAMHARFVPEAPGPDAPISLGRGIATPPEPSPTDSPESYAAHLNKLDPEGDWVTQPNATHGGTDVVSRARGNVGRSFDADGKDTGGAIGRMRGGGSPRR
jgi:flagellar biosynthesis GTPase FlhF